MTRSSPTSIGWTSADPRNACALSAADPELDRFRPDFVAQSSSMPNHSHDTPDGGRKLHELEHIADVGESEKTPWILIGETWVVTATAFLVVVALALFAYRLAS
jgi:hypothetical protein